MTPAIVAARRAAIRHQIHEYTHDSHSHAWGLEAAEKLGLDPARVFKTLLVSLDEQRLVVAVIPVTQQLNLKQIARLASAKRATMANPALAERTTGYIIGGISPLGQKRRLATWIDESATHWPTLFVSGGRRGLEIELGARDLCHLCQARLAPLTANSGHTQLDTPRP
jgi:Cys-tRNA(Pro)/Cys-tRNA(Cys) deacylase